MMVATTTHAQGVIDMHTHIITPEFVSALESEGRLLDEGFPLPKWEAEAQLQWMDEAEISTSVLTMAAPLPTSAKVIRETNEAAAKLKREHPSRFRFCAALPLPDVNAAIEEARYALDALDADGIKLATNSFGQYLGAPELGKLIILWATSTGRRTSRRSTTTSPAPTRRRSSVCYSTSLRPTTCSMAPTIPTSTGRCSPRAYSACASI